MLSLPIVVIFIATVAVLWWVNKGKKDEPNGFKPIPGPVGLPMFGNIFQIGQVMHIPFSKWAKKYGKIYQIRIGNRKAVVISDTKLIKEIFSMDVAFTGRQIFEGLEMYENEPLGIVSTEGEVWEVHRRFLLRQLREFGFGKSSMEEMVMDEVKEVIERLRKVNGESVSHMKDVFQIAVVNALWMLMGSKKWAHDDEEILNIMNTSDKIVNELMKNAITLFIPWTRHFMPKPKDFEALRDRNKKFYKEAVDFHKKTLVEDSPRDFIDVYLNEMKVQSGNPSSMFYGDKAERQLHNILGDVFFAGADTTSTTLTWAVLYLCKYPEVQKKLQSEIDEVVGRTRHATLSDKANMPYTMALIEETLRCSSIVPTGLQHRAIVGKPFKDYFIPEGTWIFPNIYHIHHDAQIWGDPENFRPERFLSADGQQFKKSENVLAFVIGRRQCIGESLARDSLFLFMANLFQTFEVKLDPSKPEPSMEPQAGIILSPQPYSVLVRERTNQ